MKVWNLIKNFIKKILNYKSRFWFRGNYKTWELALKETVGYDSEQILNKVIQATKEVVSGNAIFERDSMLFYQEEYSPVFLSMLFYVISKEENKLRAVDFGGSLGSVFFQNHKILSHLQILEWSIIEQNRFVTSGRQFFENDCLKFYYNLEEFRKSREANLIIFSSSLPYIENWATILDSVIDFNIKFILIDRTPFFDNNNIQTRICIEDVPKEIYEGSYPLYIFNQKEFESKLLSQYDKVFEFVGVDNIQLRDEKITFKGMLFERKSN